MKKKKQRYDEKELKARQILKIEGKKIEVKFRKGRNKYKREETLHEANIWSLENKR